MDRFLLGGAKRDTPAPASTQSAEAAKPSTNSWVEKYRPKSIDDIQGQPEIVAALRKFIQTGELPHLLFYGPPGTGKTSTILAAARELFGTQYRQRVLELNASDERGINVIREKVKQFARLNVACSTFPQDTILESGSNAENATPTTAPRSSALPSGGRARAAFKIIILDEADTMTDAAQSALRRIMETEASTTRFCLVCNYVSRIIEPITSRCAKFRFRPLHGSALVTILRQIATAEGFDQQSVSDDDLKLLLSLADGDFRRCVTLLQSLFAFVNAASNRGTGSSAKHAVRREDVYEIAGVIPEEAIHSVIEAARSGAFERLDKAVKNLLLNGHAARQAVIQLHDFVLEASDLSDRQRSALLEIVADCELSLFDGADEYLQLLRVANALMNSLQQRATAS